MDLRDVFPRDEIIQRVPEDVVFSEYSLDEVAAIVRLKSTSMFELGAAIWDRYIRCNPRADPRQFSDYFDNNAPMLYESIAEMLGHATIDELYYVHAELADQTADYRTVAELLIAAAYPGVIHVSDIEFSNPREPIPEEEQRYTHQHFRGLGLLPALVANSVKYGHQRGTNSICLTAAHIDLVPLFESQGFIVDDTPAGHFGLQAGSSIPMTRLIS